MGTSPGDFPPGTFPRGLRLPRHFATMGTHMAIPSLSDPRARRDPHPQTPEAHPGTARWTLNRAGIVNVYQ
jgi:hypothetical protein